MKTCLVGFFWITSFRSGRAGNFLLNGKKSPKNVSFSRNGRCPQTARPCCWLRTARIPARDHRRSRLRATGIKLLETLDGTKPRAVRSKSNIFAVLLQALRESTACSDLLQEA
jgi:hypothetical protein